MREPSKFCSRRKQKLYARERFLLNSPLAEMFSKMKENTYSTEP